MYNFIHFINYYVIHYLQLISLKQAHTHTHTHTHIYISFILYFYSCYIFNITILKTILVLSYELYYTLT